MRATSAGGVRLKTVPPRHVESKFIHFRPMRQPHLCALSLALTLTLSGFAGRAAESPEYAKPPAFIPLPLGEVKPAGWLRDWCQQALDGITGHSEELHPIFAKGWLDASEIKAETNQAGDKPRGYVLEQSSYWIDGATRLAHLMDDEALLAKCRLRYNAVLERVDAGQPPMNINQDLWLKGDKWAHWPMAILGRGMLAEYSATHDPRYLRGLEKIYADYLNLSGNGKKFSLISHSGRQMTNVEVMLEAYRLGGSPKLRDDALTILRGKADQINMRLAWHEQDILTGTVNQKFYGVDIGHAVTFNESTKIPVIAYLYSGDPVWLRFAEASYEDMEKNEMLPYGLTSAQEQLTGVGPFALTELCNAIDFSWSNIWLLRITGSAVYGDRVERTMFNAGPGSIAPDFKSHVYFMCPNRIDAKHPDRKAPHVGDTVNFSPTHNPLCCTANLSRLLPNYVMHLWMASADGGLAATLYGPSETKTTVGNTRVALATRTDYPFGDEVEIKLTPEKAAAFPLHLRIPGWSGAPTLSINGEKQKATVDHGFLHLRRTWKPGDTVRLTFSRQPKIVTGVCANGAPYASAVDGPLLFALPLPTLNGDLNKPQPDVACQFALLKNASIEVVRHPMPAHWTWNASPAPLELKVAAIPVVLDEAMHLPSAPVALGTEKPEKLTFLPFGSTAYRVSMFGFAEAQPTAKETAK